MSPRSEPDREAGKVSGKGGGPQSFKPMAAGSVRFEPSTLLVCEVLRKATSQQSAAGPRKDGEQCPDVRIYRHLGQRLARQGVRDAVASGLDVNEQLEPGNARPPRGGVAQTCVDQ